MQLMSQKEHIRADCWIRKKKQPYTNITELTGEDGKSVTFYLLQTDRSTIKINGLLTLNVHNISVPIERCFPHTLGSRGRGLHEKFCYEQVDW